MTQIPNNGSLALSRQSLLVYGGKQQDKGPLDVWPVALAWLQYRELMLQDIHIPSRLSNLMLYFPDSVLYRSNTHVFEIGQKNSYWPCYAS